jgi:hypothetical protein
VSSESVISFSERSSESSFFAFFVPSAFAKPTARQVFAACRAVGLAEAGLFLSASGYWLFAKRRVQKSMALPTANTAAAIPISHHKMD